MSPLVRRVEPADEPEWLRMRQLLWPDCPPDTHRAEMATLGGAVFVAVRECGGLCGFVEASLRSFAEGCDSGPVGYIEGWYVDPDSRRQRVGGRLLQAAEEWARASGCCEAASDAELDNVLSQQAHAALGYQEVGRSVHFRKPLVTTPDTPRPAPRLLLLPESYAICRLPPADGVPAWAFPGGLTSVTRTHDELSIVCRQDAVPEGVRCEPGWRCLRVAGTLDLRLVGVLASLTVPLAEAGVSVFAVSTYDTDYLLVRSGDLERALLALMRDQGRCISIVGRAS